MAKGIRRRMQRMVNVERRYFNRPEGLSALIGITLVLQVFTIMFCVFYMLSRPMSDENRRYVISAAALLAVFVALFVAYKLACNRFGLTYSLFMGMSAVCYAVAAVAGYFSFRCMWSWHFTDIIRDAAGYTGILNDILKTSLFVALGLLVVYVVAAFVPAKSDEPFFGRLWFLNVVVPLFCVAMSLGVLLLAPREEQLQAANWVCMCYFIVVLWLAVRYAVKALFYGILEGDRDKATLIEDIEPAAASEQGEPETGEPAVEQKKKRWGKKQSPADIGAAHELSEPLKKEDVIESIKQSLNGEAKPEPEPQKPAETAQKEPEQAAEEPAPEKSKKKKREKAAAPESAEPPKEKEEAGISEAAKTAEEPAKKPKREKKKKQEGKQAASAQKEPASKFPVVAPEEPQPGEQKPE